jgi:hypothetical protein
MRWRRELISIDLIRADARDSDWLRYRSVRGSVVQFETTTEPD